MTPFRRGLGAGSVRQRRDRPRTVPARSKVGWRSSRRPPTGHNLIPEETATMRRRLEDDGRHHDVACLSPFPAAPCVVRSNCPALQRKGELMFTEASKKPSQERGGKRSRAALSREAKAAYGEIRQGVKHLEKSMGEIQRGLRKAERKIEADARARVRELRKDAHTQLNLLKSKQRAAARSLKNLSTAAGESWREVKVSADSILAEGRATAGAVAERFRRALGG